MEHIFLDGFANFGLEMPPTKQLAKPQGKPLSFNHSMDYKSRIAQAKSIEEEIRNQIATDTGLVISPSNANQDKYEGIDGFIVSKDGGKTPCAHIPVQIKIRKNMSGNDILWETIKPWTQETNSDFEKLGDRIFNGKDMKCKAAYLISIGNNGSVVRIRKVDEIKKIAQAMTTELIQEYRATGRRNTKTTWGEAKIVADPSEEANFHMRGKIYKINCFILPGILEWKIDLNLKHSIQL